MRNTFFNNSFAAIISSFMFAVHVKNTIEEIGGEWSLYKYIVDSFNIVSKGT